MRVNALRCRNSESALRVRATKQLACKHKRARVTPGERRDALALCLLYAQRRRHYFAFVVVETQISVVQQSKLTGSNRIKKCNRRHRLRNKEELVPAGCQRYERS